MPSSKTLTILLVCAFLPVTASQDKILQFGWLMPNEALQLPLTDYSYLPDGGLNLYDKPGGEVIARLGRDSRSKDYPNYFLNIFLSPRNRTPELLSQMALAPLEGNCFAVPFVKQRDGYVLLFGSTDPYAYWASVEEIKSKQFYLTDQPRAAVQQNQNTEAGAGLLIPDFERLPELPRENFAYLPSRSLELYASPDGRAVNKLSRFCPVARYSDGNLRMFVLPLTNENECRHITLTHLVHLSDDTYVIPFFKNESGYVRLFDDAALGGTWARITDITSQNFNIVGWKEYLISRRDTPAFANGNGLNLRVGPYADAAKLLLVKGEEMQIWITGFDDGFCEGAWCKVKVKVFAETPCTSSKPESENLLEEKEGWIKLVDDDGSPNVYINTKGC